MFVAFILMLSAKLDTTS